MLTIRNISARFGALRFSHISAAYSTGSHQPVFPIYQVEPSVMSGLAAGVRNVTQNLAEFLDTSIMLIKRTWQPSLLKRKRKHGMYSRLRTRHGRKITLRRRQKGRRRIFV